MLNIKNPDLVVKKTGCEADVHLLQFFFLNIMLIFDYCFSQFSIGTQNILES